MDLFSQKEYFHFVAHKYGPYDHSIDVVSKGIKEFQKLVDSLQEDIDTHNFLTEIPFDE